MKILISGATGLVGTALEAALRADGQTIARLVRPGGTPTGGDVPWDPGGSIIDTRKAEGAEAVVHLSGASIAAGRWTEARKAVLRSSRVNSTRLLVDALGNMRQKPRVFICASAAGYYGNRGDEFLTEASRPGRDFLASVARDWEAEAMRAGTAGMRVVLLRFGIILDARRGALPKMLLPFRFGVGGRIGSGRQWMPWVALADAVGVVRAAILDDRFMQAVNVVAPNPVRNAEFARIAARVLHRPAFVPMPALVVRWIGGQMGESLLLASMRVVPARLTEMQYAFRFIELESALREILDQK